MVRIYQRTAHLINLSIDIKDYNLTNFFPRSNFEVFIQISNLREKREEKNNIRGIHPLRSIKRYTVEYLGKIQSSIPPRKTRSSRRDGERVKRNLWNFHESRNRNNGQPHVRATIDTVDLVFFDGDSVEAASSLSDLTREKFTSPRNSLHSAFSFRFSSLHTHIRAHTTPSHVRSSVHKASSHPRPPPTVLPRSSVEGGLGQPIAAMNK